MESKIQNYLTNTLNIATSLTKREKEDCMDLKTSDRNSIVKIFHFIYSNTENIKYNKEKYNSFKKFVLEFEADAT